MPRILLDVSRVLYRRLAGTLPTGIDRVCLEYVRRYGGAGRAVLSWGPFSVVLSQRDSRSVFDAMMDRKLPVRGLAARVVAKAIAWRWMAPVGSNDVLLNTSHYGLESSRYAGWLRYRGVRLVTLIHDLIPITHSRFCRPGEDTTHRNRMRCAARNSSAIVANSRHTLDEFAAFCASAGLRAPMATVAHLGLGLGRHDAGPAPLGGPYFVVLGTLEPRKNHAMLLEVWERIVAGLGDDSPKLVVIGQRGWDTEVSAALKGRTSAARGIVIALEACTDAELAAWLAHARALLFPSFAEGYGMPVPEALAAGLPVIASDLPVFREIVGDIPDFADPLDLERWNALICAYASPTSGPRDAQLARMKAFAPPTWERHFQAVDGLLARLPP